MNQATEGNSDMLAVKRMLRSLQKEMKALRQENKDQERQLKHLRRDVRTALFLGRHDDALQTSTTTQFKRFNDFPMEIREMIWECAVPSRLLRFANAGQGLWAVSSALSVPAVAHVCQESRRVVLSPKRGTTLPGKSHHLGGPSQLWRLHRTSELGSAYWTWFTPSKDVLLLDSATVSATPGKENERMLQVAEHVIVHFDFWTEFAKFELDEDEDGHHLEEAEMLDGLISGLCQMLPAWKNDMLPKPESLPTGGPAWNLRTVDFPMTGVEKIDRNYPPNFVHRLFRGESVRLVDLRDDDAVRGIQQMLVDELSQFVPPDRHLWSPEHGLQLSLRIFKAANAPFFKRLRDSWLKGMTQRYRKGSSDPQNPRPTLPSPFNSKSELDMEVTWVKEFTERLNIRPVHVFIRVDDMLAERW